jgi:glucokinase
VLITLDNLKKFIIGIDIGKTNTVIAIGDLNGKLIKLSRKATVKDPTVSNVIGHISHILKNIIEEAETDKERIVGVGVSAAGIVNSKKGVVELSPDFNWKNILLENLLASELNYPVVIDNCTRVMMLGETWYGNAKKVRNAFFVNIGYGIGSAVIKDGKIYNNHSEFGHLYVTNKNVKCYCGKYGCLEAIASGNAIEKIANKTLNTKGKNWLTAKDVAMMARDGNKLANKIFIDAGKYIGRSISSVANFLNPEKIIIGGGVSLAGDLLLNPIIKEFQKQTMEVIKSSTSIEFSKLGMDAGVLGATALGLNHFIFQPERNKV